MIVGTGRRVINPERGHYLAGYGSNYPCDGVHDDISVTALYFNDGEREAVLISFDLAGMCKPMVDEIREAVAEKIGLPHSAVFSCTTHVHSGPEVRDNSDGHKRPAHMLREDYNQRLKVWTVEAALEARENTVECSLFYNHEMVKENMNRRFSFPNRVYKFIPNHKNLTGLSEEYVDHELGLVGFRIKGESNRFKAVLTNYTAHPLCVGNSGYLVSADYQGYLRRTVEETFTTSLCLTTTGAAGDQHPLMPESGYIQAERMGKTLGSAAICRLYDAPHAGKEEKLRMKSVPVFVKGREGCSDCDTTIDLLGIGPLLFVGMPGELVGKLGAAFKWSSPFLRSYIMMNATDNIGYIPARNQFHWGGYEVTSSYIQPGEGEKLVNLAIESACEMLDAEPLDIPAHEGWD